MINGIIQPASRHSNGRDMPPAPQTLNKCTLPTHTPAFHADKPCFDMVTFSIRFGSKRGYTAFCAVIEEGEGSLRPRKNRAGRWCRYVGDITIEPPAWTLKNNKYGWGRVYFLATIENLARFQSWVELWLAGDINAMRERLTWRCAELAWDFDVGNGSYMTNEGVLKRIFYRLSPFYMQGVFGVWISNGLTSWDDLEQGKKSFNNLNDALRYYGKCEDGAVNGDICCYIQSCKPEDRAKSSNSLDVNHHASRHTKIYIKCLNQKDNKWHIRIELTLKKKLCKRYLPINYKKFSDIFLYLENLPFSKFYELREADFEIFSKQILAMPEAKKLKKDSWLKTIEETKHMPVADKLRIMREMAKLVGKRRLYDTIKTKYTYNLDLKEAINKRLPAWLEPSRRTKKGEAPDGLQFKEPLQMLVRIGKPKEIRISCLNGYTIQKPGNGLCFNEMRNAAKSKGRRKKTPTSDIRPPKEIRMTKEDAMELMERRFEGDFADEPGVSLKYRFLREDALYYYFELQILENGAVVDDCDYSVNKETGEILPNVNYL